MKFQVETRSGVTLVTGSMPVSMLSSLTESQEAGAVISPDAARLLGVDWAIGQPDDIEKLIQPIRSGKIPPANPTKIGSLSDKAKRWLDLGERGLSSDALFAVVHNCPGALGDPADAKRYPRDPADFRRCLMMLRETEATDRIHLAAGLSPYWKALVDHWSELEAMLLEEVPTWATESPQGSASATFKAMQSLFARIQRDEQKQSA